ncbi:hypothetical protein AbraIFM66951_004713 [Aspergillus brasiliensis]|uniref:Uncharacterized protein n=1 Tax=Aspergillus brasiliensis TaxID=319629 RepID=A0A9W5YK44_9EURO|nr:hypothetical protein AbraCBS73388_008336 [Aspergillus brasiliensis]GKZ43468.1 hypothetical protein AbraIFM66951_004713 [Aspergillus brasiliensis]
MAPTLLSNNLRTTLKSLSRIIRHPKDKGKIRSQPDLTFALARLFASTEEDDDEDSSIINVVEHTSQLHFHNQAISHLVVEDQDPTLVTLLHTLSSTQTASTSDSFTLLPFLTSALNTLSTYTQSQSRANTLPLYTALLRHLDTYTSYLIWDHEILLTDADIIFTASTTLPTFEYQHNIILQLEAAYVSNYETCKALVSRLGRLVDMEIIKRADWVFPRQTGWVEAKMEANRVRETLEEIRWAGKLEVRYVDY